MPEEWWSYGQVCNYLLANYPCDSPMHAAWLVENRVEDGTFRTRLRDVDSGKYIEIRSDEWRRDGNRLTLEPSMIGHGPNNVEYLAADVKKLRDAAPGPLEREGGRPSLKDWDRFWLEVVRIANSLDGLPDAQAELERTMAAWCANHLAEVPKESEIRARVSMIYQHRRQP